MPQKLTFLACLWLFLTSFLLPVAAETVPVVRTKTEAFHNVTLVSKTDTHAFFKHSRGVANVRQTDLNVETLVALGLATSVAEAEVVLGIVKPDAASDGAAALGAAVAQAWQRTFSEGENSFAPDSRILFILLGVFLAVWLFFSYCLMLICKKAGADAGLLVWLPVLQMIPMFRAAGMSPLWLVGMFIPVVNIVGQVLWAINISKVRGKGTMTIIMLLLPVTNLFAFMYLAFSDAVENPDDVAPTGPLRLEPLPSS